MIYPAYMVLALCFAATAGGFVLGYFLHDRISIWVRSHRMSSSTRPTKPRPPGRYVRQQLQEIDVHAGAADRRLEQLSETSIDAARAQGLIRLIQLGIARVLGMGVDDEDTSNGGH